MSATVDHSDDYLCWDDIVSGSVDLIRASGTENVNIARMMMGPWTRKIENFGGMNFDGQIVAWSIPDKLLNPTRFSNPGGNEGRTIERDDVITGEDGIRWTVIFSEQSVKGSHWNCAAVKERV